MAPPSPMHSLPYPQRFEAAVAFVERLRASAPAGSKPLKDDAQLLLYALHQQVVKGPCNLAKPSSWGSGGSQELLKWKSWKGLGDMSGTEAMRLYVRTLEEEEPNWLGIAQEGNGATPFSTATPASAEPEPSRSAVEWAASDAWVAVPTSASQRAPLPRYEHAGAMLGHNFIVVGGNYGGRYLNDVWKLSTKTMQWSQIQTRPFAGASSAAAPPPPSAEPSEDGAKQQQQQQQQPVLGPLAGHTVTPWNDTLVIIGGHTKVSEGATAAGVQVMDLVGEVAKLAPHGTPPPPRGSHTATLVGRRIYVFGGEDPRHRPLGDLWYLDLDSLTWGQPEVKGKAPAARSAHAAVAYNNRYLLVFGGGSIATCHADVHVLDTHAVPMEWSQPKVAGPKITPRAGHTGVLVGSTWYIVGGGNNKTGCTDMLALELSQLEAGEVSWRSAASIPARHPLSSEGVSLANLGPVAPGAQEHVLLAFGGYNGKYQNSVHVIRVSDAPQAAGTNGTSAHDVATPSKAPQSQAQAAGAAPTAASAAPAPTPPPKSDAELLAETRAKLEAAQRDAEAAIKEAAAAKETAGHELALLRKQVNTAHTTAADAQKELEVAKVSLSREREKVMKLEAEVAELRRKLDVAAQAQRDLDVLQQAVKESEAKKTNGGIWGYLSGQA